MGLPKEHRLKRRDDFSLIHQKGQRFKSAHLGLRVFKRSRHLIAPSAKQSEQVLLPTRIGVPVGLKVDKRAVVRNRIRRQVQAVLQQLLPWLQPGLDLLIVVYPQAVQCDYHQFLQELEQLLTEAEVLNGYPGRGVLRGGTSCRGSHH